MRHVRGGAFRAASEPSGSGPSARGGAGTSRRRPAIRAVHAALAAAVLVACGSGGSGGAAGDDTTAPSVPAGVVARAASADRIDVTWAASSDDVGVSGYRVRRGGEPIATETATSYSDQGRAPATSYCYTVSAFDAGGNESAPSAPACATTLPPPDPTPPTTPGDVVARGASPTRIDVTWAASSDDVGVVGYRVRRNGSVIASPATTSFSERGLSPESQYCYTVSAIDAAGNESDRSPFACATTLADTTPPAAPADVVATAVSSARIRITWAAASDDVEIAGYRVRRDGALVLATPATAWDDPTRSPRSRHCYSVAAYDTSDNESAPSPDACATTPLRPIAPTGVEAPLVLADGGDGTVTDGVTGLVWQQATVGPYNWYEATGTPDAALNPPGGVDACGDLLLGGETGWRLPSDAEILDVADFHLLPPLDPAVFTLAPAPNDLYWTSTGLAPDTARIWFQGLGWLGVGLREARYAIRCVLGGPGLPPSLADRGDGTVLDATTGLVWQQGDGGVLSHDGPGGAVAYCEGLALGGRDDWRLPTVKEAKSLTPIDLAAFPGTRAEPFWTSTPGLGGYWWVEPAGGMVNTEGALVPEWARCVRGP